ncbi:MAG: hypothetical protein PHH70_02370 [Candidatus Gracilibacteria bacterium]|nr:hypothetical protein [Candidatus Gracilibacteria bacterium]
MLDTNSIRSFLDADIHEIFISFTSGGCAGTKVSVETKFDRTGLVSSPITDSLVAFYKQEERELLAGGRITFVKGKWIFSSDKVQDRCGCGSSFSFEKKLIDTDKLAKLQGIFGKKKKECEE